jgi:hypothetical protein
MTKDALRDTRQIVREKFRHSFRFGLDDAIDARLLLESVAPTAQPAN